MKVIDLLYKIVNEEEIPDHVKIVDFDIFKDESSLPEIFERLYYDDIGLLDDVEIVVSPEDRIQKAIEYIKENADDNCTFDFTEELLDILTGGKND